MALLLFFSIIVQFIVIVFKEANFNKFFRVVFHNFGLVFNICYILYALSIAQRLRYCFIVMTKLSAFERIGNTPVNSVFHPILEANQVALWLLRLDQTHPAISGNKWFKLKYNLQYALNNGYRSVLSFGGAYSNHIHALAWAAKAEGLNSIGVIRGEPEYISNPTLSDAAEWGMKLQFVNRKDYKLRAVSEFQTSLLEQLPDSLKPILVIPEGGSNALAVEGSKEILSPDLIKEVAPDQIMLACGTGGTLAGVALSQPTINVMGIPVLKKADFLYQDIKQLIASAGEVDPENWQLDLQGHFGGYGKCSDELLASIKAIESSSSVPLDQVYTGKMMLRILQLVEQGEIKKGSTILGIHTGGLQGRRSVHDAKN